MSPPGAGPPAGGFLELHLGDAVIGIDAIEVLVPPMRRSVNGRARGAQRPERLEAVWEAAHLEPEKLTAYFASQERPIADGGRPWRASVACAEGESAGDLAVRVTRALVQRDQAVAAEVGLLLHCQSTMDQRPTWSTVCRIQHDLGFRHATGFAINQVGGASSLMALQIACQTMTCEDGLGAALIIASEKVVPPQQQFLASWAVLGDGASALLVRRSRPCPYRVRSVVLWAAPMRGALGGGSVDSERPSVVAGLATLLRAACERAGQTTAADLVVLPNLRRSVLQEMAAQARGMGLRTCVGHIPGAGCLGSSDLAVGLQLARKRKLVKPGGMIFALGVGVNSALGCATLSAEPC
jgi:hypothetical protein